MSMKASTPIRDVILRDGETLRLRPPVSEDADRLLAFFAGLTPDSLRFRFHGLRAVVPDLVTPFLTTDGNDRGGLIATTADDGDEEVVAVASWARLRDPVCAEVAFAVADEFQGRGVGTRLVEQLAAVAGATGVETFVAEVMPDNRAMLRVFEDAGFDITRHIEGGTVEVRFSIEPTERYRERVDERDHVAVVASLRPFFEATSVAVIGASARPGSIGGTVFRNIRAGGFTGRSYAVNHSGEPVAGVPAVQSLSEIHELIDLAVICVPADRVLDAAREALHAGTNALCVISAGFAETGPEGAARQERLLALVRAHRARLIGPNCLGLAVTGSRLNATFARIGFPIGSIGFGSQSGALGLALLEAAEGRGIGFSSFVSIGNKADVSSNDLLEWWAEDAHTELAVLYLESFGNPRKFARTARRLARQKPLLALKSGASAAGARAASSHTAALAGSETAVDALFHQAGVIRAETLEELLDVAALYAAGPAPSGPRVAVMTNAGGPGILCADACEVAGLELSPLSPETHAALAAQLPAEAGLGNPVDMLGSATAASYEATLPLFLDDPHVDAVIVLFVPAATVEAIHVAAAIARARDNAASDKPFLSVVMSAEASHPTFVIPEGSHPFRTQSPPRERWAGQPPERAGFAGEPAPSRPLSTSTIRRRGEHRRSAETPNRTGSLPRNRATSSRHTASLSSRSESRNRPRRCTSRRRTRLPRGLKTATPGVHKTEVHGVELGLENEESVRLAASRIGPPLLVQPMVEGGIELLAGLVQDPLFGPLVAFGPGGMLAELIGEATFRIAPLTDVDAEELVLEGKAGRLVGGFRGLAPASVRLLTDVLHRLSRLGVELPEVAELDLNPVLAFPDRCVVADARLRVARTATGVQTKTW